MNYFIRILQFQDVPKIVGIEELSFDTPIERESVECFMRKPAFGFVSVYQTSWQAERLAGYLLGEMRDRYIRIHRFATHPDWRRKGVASKLFEAVIDKLNDRHVKLMMMSQETNMPVCLLMKSLGFDSKLVGGVYDVCDGIRFCFRSKRYA